MVKDLGRILVKVKALEFGAFTLTSGISSSYYIDLRLIPSYPGVFRKTVQAYVQLLVNDVGLENFDAVCAIPTAGLTYASAIAYELKKPLIYVRKKERLHGIGKRIEGAVTPGGRVLLVDDLITTGTSMIHAVEAIRSEGATVEDAAVLIDRLEGAKRSLKGANVRLHSLTEIAELTDTLYDMDVITEEQKKAIHDQVKDEV